MEEEGGFADAAGAMEEEGLGDAVVEGVVVEDALHERPRDDTPRGGNSGGASLRRRPRRRRRRRGVGHLPGGGSGADADGWNPKPGSQNPSV